MARPSRKPLSENDAGRAIREQVSRFFAGSQLFLELVSPRLFVCGGPTKKAPGKRISRRRKFLEWLSKQEPRFAVILAEDIYSLAQRKSEPFLNLNSFESVLAELSDCTLVFPESVGSWAEVGFFSAIEKLAKRLSWSLITPSMRINPSFPLAH